MTVRHAPASVMEDWLAAIFAAADIPADEARIIAENLVLADLSGHPSHGIARTARYVEWAREGRQRPAAKVDVVMRSGPLALIDGNRSFGQIAGIRACDLAEEIAREHGAAIVGLRKSGHVGRVGHWAEMLAAKGLWSIHWVNVAGSRLVAPFGGMDRRLGTNPVCVGVPRPKAGEGDGPFILDFATSRVAEGKVLVALQSGKPLPEDALVDDEGRDSTDPVTLYGQSARNAAPDPRMGPGALQTMGQHKGSGLAIACDLLAGALIGSDHNADPDAAFCNGMLSIVIDPARFGDPEGIAEQAEAFIAHIRASAPRGGDPVLTPGDPERAGRAKGAAEGVPLSEGLLKSLREASAGTGVPVPAGLA